MSAFEIILPQCRLYSCNDLMQGVIRRHLCLKGGRKKKKKSLCLSINLELEFMKKKDLIVSRPSQGLVDQHTVVILLLSIHFSDTIVMTCLFGDAFFLPLHHILIKSLQTCYQDGQIGTLFVINGAVHDASRGYVPLCAFQFLHIRLLSNIGLPVWEMTYYINSFGFYSRDCPLQLCLLSPLHDSKIEPRQRAREVIQPTAKQPTK